ncbi:cation diffusion facilitator family transporter [Alteribacter aurantiacus]|uniref:cation diffusion facilitator family transporter n=1 Tax=Alteribacter aurantiacus TaxID=254410 RepID=UPI00040AAC3A|nr:cation diffusion facilitator family transporter [Alteribacter aurantiacus]
MLAEKNILKVSVYGALVFALVAIVWGVLGNSQMILFDGLYSLISVALSFFSLLSASFIQKADYKRFPFGKEMLEPIVILSKYVVILLLCLYALSSALSDLLAGGRVVDPGMALIYAILATIGCYIVYVYLKKRKKKLNSGFVEAEANQWLMDCYLSFGVMLGFLVATLMTFTPFQSLIPYVDPLMVIIVAGYFVKVPLVSIKEQLREVLEMAPEPFIQEEIERVTYDLEKKYNFDETFIRVAKVGSKLFIEIDFIVDPKTWEPTVKEQDQIREELLVNIKDVSYTKWLTISFTSDRKWAV